MKNSGSEPDCDTENVLDLGFGNPEVIGDVRNTVARLEAIDEVLHACTAVNNKRLAKRDLRIDGHLRLRVGG